MTTTRSHGIFFSERRMKSKDNMIQSGGKKHEKWDKRNCNPMPLHSRSHTDALRKTHEKNASENFNCNQQRYDCDSCVLLHCNSSLCTFIVVVIILSNFSPTRHDHLSRAFVVATQFSARNSSEPFCNWMMLELGQIYPWKFQTELFSINRQKFEKQTPHENFDPKNEMLLNPHALLPPQLQCFWILLHSFFAFDSSSSLRQFACREMIMNARSIIKSK